MLLLETDTTEHICEYEFQVTHPNSDIDFVTVYDLPANLCEKWVKNKYPNCTVEQVSF